MSINTITQFYNDLKWASENLAQQFVGDYLVMIFNAHLNDANQQVPNDPILSIIKEADNKTTFLEMHCASGQIKQALEDHYITHPPNHPTQTP